MSHRSAGPGGTGAEASRGGRRWEWVWGRAGADQESGRPATAGGGAPPRLGRPVESVGLCDGVSRRGHGRVQVAGAGGGGRAKRTAGRVRARRRPPQGRSPKREWAPCGAR